MCLLCHSQRLGLLLQVEPQRLETVVVYLQSLDDPEQSPEQWVYQENIAEIKIQWNKQGSMNAKEDLSKTKSQSLNDYS